MVPLLAAQACVPPSNRLENYGWVYQTREAECVHARAILDPDNGTYFGQETSAKFALGGTPWGEWTPCAISWQRPSGYMAGRVLIMAWWLHPPIPYIPHWAGCADTGVYYSNRALTTMTNAVNYSPGDAPCGSTYYYNHTEAWVRNGQWYGGPLTTDLVWSD